MDDLWPVFLFSLFGWLATLSGVALGGWLVFRTKRESYDPLIGSAPKGEAFNLDDAFDYENVKSSASLPKSVVKNHDKFVEQFAENLADNANKKE